MANEFPFAISTDGTTWYTLDGKTNNSKTLPAIKYQGAKYSRQAVDGSNAGRNQAGKMVRELITQKDKWQLEFAPCTQAQLGALLGLIDGNTFYFQYPDPLYGSNLTGHGTAFRTAKFYVGDRSAPVFLVTHTGTRTVELWGNVTFNFIEV